MTKYCPSNSLGIQRDVIEAMVQQDSSQSQDHTIHHTATISDLSQSEGGAEDQQSLLRLLTSCQDISSLEVSFSPANMLTKPKNYPESEQVSV